MTKATHKKGFTIIETLVAIAILMIAIAGPLTIANKGLQTATYARDQMIASYLAQETMEYMKNTRDNNIYSGYNWLNGFGSGGSCVNSTGNYCDADPRDGFTQANCPGIGTDPKCQLFIDSNGYNHKSLGSPSPFYRFFSMESQTADGQPTGTEETAHVVVYWMEGSIPYDVDLTSQFVDHER